MIYTAERINAKQALEIGLIDKITQKDDLIEKAINIATQITSQASLAVASAKTAINKGINVDIDTALSIETDIFIKCFETQDQKNVMAAFLKKEKFTKFKNK